jgi:5-methylcytosine-specific restriction endonuclease McrA
MSPTIEHLVPVAHGGPNHLSNCFLAHKRCNAAAGTLSAAEKVRLRDAMRAKRRAA